MAEIAVIKDFGLGIGESEFVGNGEIRNCDLSGKTGAVLVTYEALKVTGSIFTDRPSYIVTNPDSSLVSTQQWAVDDTGDVYQGTSSVTWAKIAGAKLPSAGLGAQVWKDYLFLATAATAYAYGPLTAGSANLVDFQTITSDTSYHPIKVGQDDILYIGAGRHIASLQEVTGQTFAAGTAATYTFAKEALDIPEQERIRALGESGRNLMIGTWSGSADGATKIANIYPWDRTSDSFNLPIRMNDNGIQSMVEAENLLYFLSGIRGNLNVTDGTNVRELVPEIPQFIFNDSAQFVTTHGQMIYHDNKILFTNSDQDAGDFRGALVWSYDINKDVLAVENTVSAGTTNVSIGGLLSTGRRDYLIGWEDGTGDGIDHVSGSQRYTNYAAFVDSPYLQIGTRRKPAIISEIEIQLARPLATGEGIRLNYRTDLSTGHTRVPGGTIDFATFGAIQEQEIKFDLEVKNGVQIRAEITSESGQSETPELMSIILR